MMVNLGLHVKEAIALSVWRLCASVSYAGRTRVGFVLAEVLEGKLILQHKD